MLNKCLKKIEYNYMHELKDEGYLKKIVRKIKFQWSESAKKKSSLKEKVWPFGAKEKAEKESRKSQKLKSQEGSQLQEIIDEETCLLGDY